MDFEYLWRHLKIGMIVIFSVCGTAIALGLFWSWLSGTPLVYWKFIGFWVSFAIMVLIYTLFPFDSRGPSPYRLFPKYSHRKVMVVSIVLGIVTFTAMLVGLDLASKIFLN